MGENKNQLHSGENASPSPYHHSPSGTSHSLQRNYLVKGSQYLLTTLFPRVKSKILSRRCQTKREMNLFIPQSRIYSSKIFATTVHGSQGSRQHGQCLRFLLARIPTGGHSRLPCLLQRRTRTLQDFLGPRRSEKDSVPCSAVRTPCRQFLELPSAILSRGAVPVETGSLTKRVFKGLTLLTPANS